MSIITDDLKRQAEEACKTIIMILLDAIVFISLVVGSWFIDIVLGHFGYQSGYLVELIHKFGHPILFFSFFTISSVRILISIVSQIRFNRIVYDPLAEPISENKDESMKKIER